MTVWLTRKLSLVCAEYGCPNEPLEDNCRCAGCRDAHRRRNAASARRTRRMRLLDREQLVLGGV